MFDGLSEQCTVQMIDSTLYYSQSKNLKLKIETIGSELIDRKSDTFLGTKQKLKEVGLMRPSYNPDLVLSAPLASKEGFDHLD